MIDLPHVRFIPLLLIVVLLWACGRTQDSASVGTVPATGQHAATAMVVQHLPTATLTSWQRNDQATYEAIIPTLTAMPTLSANDYATADAFDPWGTPDVPFPPANPTEFSQYSAEETSIALGYIPTPLGGDPTPMLGLYSCGEHTSRYETGRCWAEKRSTGYMYAYTFLYRSEDPLQTQLIVYTTTLRPQIDLRGEERQYPIPQKVRLVEITSVTYPLMTLTSVTTPSMTFTFNLDTRQWVTTSGTPVGK